MQKKTDGEQLQDVEISTADKEAPSSLVQGESNTVEAADGNLLEIVEGHTQEQEDELNEAEVLLAQRLAEGVLESPPAQEEALKRLPPRWEIRIQAQNDPIAEETAAYRALAKEVDNRYDK